MNIGLLGLLAIVLALAVPDSVLLNYRRTDRFVRTLPDRRLAFFAGPKKVSKETTIAGSGHFAYAAGAGSI